MPTMLNASDALHFPGQVYPVSAEVTLAPMEILSDPVRFFDIRLIGELVGAEEAVSLRGRVLAKAETRCARCLWPVTIDVEAEVDDVFVRERDPNDPDPYLFEGSSIPLDDAVRDALVLAIPYRIVCSESCKGLCPQCGKNLNEGSCTCQEGGEVTNPFSALRSIVEKNEEV